MVSSKFWPAHFLNPFALTADVGKQILGERVFDLDQRQVEILCEKLHQQRIAVSREGRPHAAFKRTIASGL